MVIMLLPAGEIPDETQVRKVTGTTWYTLKKEIKLYSAAGAKQEIKLDNTVFLVGDRGNINGIALNTLLAVELEEEEAIEVLQERIESKDDR